MFFGIKIFVFLFKSKYSYSLQYTGVLAQGAHNKQVEIADANGITPLVRQLRSSSSSVVTAVIQTLRHLCLSIGGNCHKYLVEIISYIYIYWWIIAAIYLKSSIL